MNIRSAKRIISLAAALACMATNGLPTAADSSAHEPITMVIAYQSGDEFLSLLHEKYPEIDLQFEDNAAVCVVLASDGYPVSYEKGFVISGLENFDGKDGYYCFHAGTKLTDKGIVTNGGRVLGVTAKGADLKEARANAYAATEWISFENKYMRHDIGKAIDEA